MYRKLKIFISHSVIILATEPDAMLTDSLVEHILTWNQAYLWSSKICKTKFWYILRTYIGFFIVPNIICNIRFESESMFCSLLLFLGMSVSETKCSQNNNDFFFSDWNSSGMWQKFELYCGKNSDLISRTWLRIIDWCFWILPPSLSTGIDQ